MLLKEKSILSITIDMDSSLDIWLYVAYYTKVYFIG